MKKYLLRTKTNLKSIEKKDTASKIRNTLNDIKVGDRVWYSKENIHVTVKKIHYDDVDPYFTIEKSDGLEKQTIRKFLEKK